MTLRLRRAVLPPLATLAALALAACSAGADDGEGVKLDTARSALAYDTNPQVDPASVAQLTRDNAAFATDLYRQLGKGKFAGQNLFFSPHSVSTAFAMLLGGARGETERTVAAGLHATLPQATLHAATNRLAIDLRARSAEGGAGSDGKGFRLNVTNSFWGERGLAWEAPYLDVLAVNYDAGIHRMDFVGAAEAARGTINAWTKEKTEGRVPDLLPAGALDASTRFVLLNTVYFNAAWQETFSETEVTFAALAGARAVPGIRGVGGMRHAALEGAEAVAIPYEGGKLELVAVRPDDLAEYEAKLDGAALDGVFAALAPAEVDVTLPKITIEGSSISLKDELSALGMGAIFDGGDFSGMTTSADLRISDVFHKAFVKIDEKGTEAAAATAIVGNELSAAVDPPKVVKLDRPFVFFVRDVPTGAVLFTGRVLSP